MPLWDRKKTPRVARGLNDASNNPDQVETWWKTWPNANIAIVTGVVFDALDLDGPSALATLAELTHGYKHTGPVSATGKGYHLLFRATGSGNHAKMFESTIDYRGKQGYIVVAPSIHPDGHLYLWKQGGLLPPAPDWLHTALFPPPRPRLYTGDTTLIAQAKDRAPGVEELFRQIGVRPTPQGHKNGSPILRGECPFHDDSTPSLSIYLWDNSFFCHGCREYGDNLNLVNYIQNGHLR